MKLLELFKGTGSIGKVAKKMGMSVISLDNEEKYNPDILTDILKWDYKKYSSDNKYVPNLIWASVPCETFSILGNTAGGHREKGTGKALSDNAKIGDKILKKTMEIINYFKSKNKDLNFVIENPRGFMRVQPILKNLHRETTIYVLYGDKRYKPTDFFSNIDLKLKEVISANKVREKYKVKLDDVRRMNCLEKKFKVPSLLVKTILTQLK